MSRAQRADNMTQLAMSEAIGKMYAERYFPAEQKVRVQKIVANVTAAFAHRVEAVTWMSLRTKAVALEKLKTLYVGVGSPEHWSDYSDLGVDSADAVGNLRRVADRNYRHAVSLLGTPVDMTQWWMAPQTVGAVLVFQQNAYDSPRHCCSQVRPGGVGRRELWRDRRDLWARGHTLRRRGLRRR